MNNKHIAGIVGVVILAFCAWIFYSQLFYTNDATHLVVMQRPISGTLDVVVNAGTKFRAGSSVYEYNKQDNFDFEWHGNPDGTAALNSRAIPVQFNDGGKAVVSGNVQWEMPLDEKNAVALHTLYGSQASIDNNLIRNAVNRALTLTAPLMSSTESYAQRRSEFLTMFNDQLLNGIYQTSSYEDQAADPVTGERKVVRISVIQKDKDGMPMRSEESPLKKFGITIQTPLIDGFHYESSVEAQIQQQRTNIMAIQTAQAEAKKAEQAAITAAKSGEANAMTAKWEQEVVKAKNVTAAESEKQVAETHAAQEKSVQETAAARDKSIAETAAQRDLQVATLKAQTAAQYKQEQTLMGEGEAARKLAVMTADGALTQKVDAWLKSQEVWAAAFAKYGGDIVPRVVTGGTAGTTNGAMDFMTLMGAKAANDLAVDMRVRQPAPANK